MSTEFDVYGPFEIRPHKGVGAKIINKESINIFLQNAKVQDLARRKGCYIFGLRIGKSIKPAYVGKTNNRFKDEMFQAHKINVLYEYLSHTQRGSLVVFFVTPQIRRGKIAKGHIDELEAFLIQKGLKANPKLANIFGKKETGWRINGVFGNRPGKPSKDASDFNNMMKIKLQPKITNAVPKDKTTKSEATDDSKIGGPGEQSALAL